MERIDFVDVPVIVDDVKYLPEFQMTRCIYFTIECDEPTYSQVSPDNKVTIPFLLLNQSGIIFAPSVDQEQFDKPEAFELMHDQVETIPGFYIDTNDIWLPNFIFTEADHGRIKVFRVKLDLFIKACHYREGRISVDEFMAYCEENTEDIKYSKNETVAYEQWSDGLIKTTITRYHENTEKQLSKLRK